jgi:hypothetical protein
MNDFNFIPQGWECPKCKRVYSPTTSMCIACPINNSTITTNNYVGGQGIGNTTHLFVPVSETSSVCKVCGFEKSTHLMPF